MSERIVDSFLQPAVVDQRTAADLRRAFGCFGTGVTVVTTCDDGGAPVGMTVNSFASVSMDPPLVSWNIRRHAPSFTHFAKSGHFAINVLSIDQCWIGEQMARPSENKFAGVGYQNGLGGSPILDASSATFVCRTYREVDAGDHLIMIGEVLEYAYSSARPLLFVNGRFHAGVTL
jgi:flavin reductase (DIM6/NTAB) family NADH-FMN oxidoreductase RutF